MRSTSIIHSVAILASFSITGVQAFAPSLALSSPCRAETTIFATDDAPTDPQEVIGKTIKVVGDVNGGYVRTCIKNEASNFRRLIGTMSPPASGSDEATIYVEGKRKMVDGFVRWCEKGTTKVGLSQKLEVVSATEEVPTGLYDGFYVKVDDDEKE